MQFKAEYHLNCLDDEGRKADLLFPGEKVRVYLKDGVTKNGILYHVGPKGIYLENTSTKKVTHYSFHTIKYLQRKYIEVGGTDNVAE